MGSCDACAYSGRIAVLLFGGGGIACSIMVALSCEFFKFRASDEAEFKEPFENITQAYVGILRYTLEGQGGECIDYKDDFLNSKYGEMFQAAQFCAVAAPSFAFVAWMVNLAEMLFCSYMCSFILSCLLFLVACVVQGCTFLVFGQNEFCFDDNVSDDCSLEIGAILSIVATIIFYLCSIILCCMPRPDPCLRMSRKSGEEDNSSRKQGSDALDPTQPPEEWEPQSY